MLGVIQAANEQTFRTTSAIHQDRLIRLPGQIESIRAGYDPVTVILIKALPSRLSQSSDQHKIERVPLSIRRRQPLIQHRGDIMSYQIKVGHHVRDLGNRADWKITL